MGIEIKIQYMELLIDPYQILWTWIIRIVWKMVRKITNLIIGAEGLITSIITDLADLHFILVLFLQFLLHKKIRELLLD